MGIQQRKVKRRDFLKLGAVIGGSLAFSSPIKHLNKFNGLAKIHTTSPNPALKKMGFKENERVLIAQVDDIGMFEANMSAYTDLLAFGLISSASAIPAGIWFPQIAHLARVNPNADIGVQLTLTSEWDPLRWRPISTIDSESGLLDANGYFPKTIDDIPSALTNEVITNEFDMQIQRGQRMGIRPTHIDSHQGVAFDPRFTSLFVESAKKFHLPLVFLRENSSSWNTLAWIQQDWKSNGSGVAGQLESEGFPMLDSILDLTITPAADRITQVKEAIDAITPGLHLIKIHAAKETPELKAITSAWQGYVSDFNAWMSADLAAHIQKSGVRLVGWNMLQL